MRNQDSELGGGAPEVTLSTVEELVEAESPILVDKELRIDDESAVSDENAATEEKSLSKMRLYTRRFLRNRPAVCGLVALIALILFALFGGRFTDWDYKTLDRMSLSQPPSAEHWFGTTSAGADLYAQVVHGLGRSLIIAITVSLATTVIAAFVGSVAAYLGGRPEKVILTIIHFLLIIPSFLLIAIMVSGSGGDWKILIVMLTLFGWMYSARVIWSLAISIREREYVQAARFMGVSGVKTVFRHIIPNIGSLLIIYAVLGVVNAVMSETSLSFLGLGVKLPDVSLGNLLTEGANSIRTTTWVFWFSAGALMLLTISMALIADGLRDALDPNSSAGGQA